jgi:hypothetical protein
MLSVYINPDCFDPAKPVYNAEFARLKTIGRSAAIRINLEIPSTTVDFEQVFPVQSKQEYIKGFTAHAFHIQVNAKQIDETALKYAGTGFQGSIMFGLAHLVQRGSVIAKDNDTGTVRTATQIRDFAVNGTW